MGRPLYFQDESDLLRDRQQYQEARIHSGFCFVCSVLEIFLDF